MAGPFDLTGQNIENTYQRLLQTPDGVTFYDGTGSLVTLPSANTASLLTTASVALNVITFTKGDTSQFSITVDTGSGGPSTPTFPYTGSAIISGSLTVIGNSYVGNPLALALNTTIYIASIATGNYILYSLPTASYDGFWFEYTARSGSNARAGQMMGIWSGSDVRYTETTTTDFGITTDISFMSTVVAGDMVISSSILTNDWTIKGIIRSI